MSAAEQHRSPPDSRAPEVLPALRFDSVSKSFAAERGGATPVLKDVSLSIAQQQFVAVIGPSGCGKTTLLRLANGLIAPDQGSVLVGGHAPMPGPAMGFVFQGFQLVPWMTVGANIGFALEASAISKQARAERVRAVIDLVGLARFVQHYPAQLSGGMAQRVALARALVAEPHLLLMDEPFASLDALTRELMQSELLELWTRRRATVLFVTHSVDEALMLADTIIVMGSGRVMETFSVELDRPRHPSDLRADPRFIAMREHLWNRLSALVLNDPTSAFFGRGRS